MITVSPSLTFNGDCEAAFKFYEKTLGGKISFMMTWGESPMADAVPPEMAKKIIHASFKLGEEYWIGSDTPPKRFEKAQGMQVCLEIPEPAEADRIFNALAEKGNVQMPIESTFWAARFGMVTDQFGIPWMINSSRGK